MALSRSIADIARRRAEGRAVRAVEIDVGELRQVVPDTLRRCWTLLVRGSDLDGAALRVNRIPAVLGCRACGARTTPTDLPILVCGACAAPDVEVVSGEEFLVRALEVD
jgi:hydrogenase nickel incorporation protein HypA/HybF